MPKQEPPIAIPPAAPHAAAYAGLIFAILFTLSIVLIRHAMPGTLSEVLSERTDITVSRSLIIGLNLLPFAGIAFLWFIGVIRDYIGNREDRFFATVILGSGLLFIAMLFVAAGIAGSLVTSITNASNPVDVETFLFGRAMSNTLAYVYGARMAGVFMISTSMLTRRVELIPRWLAWLGVLFAVILLLGIRSQEWILLLFPLWVFIFSVYILRTPHPPVLPAHPGEGE